MDMFEGIQCKQMSENEFSFTWSFKVSFDLVRSPNLGSACEAFSDCYMETDFGGSMKKMTARISRIFRVYLYIPDKLIKKSPKASFTARLLNSLGAEITSVKSKSWITLTSRIEILEKYYIYIARWMNTIHTVIFDIELLSNSTGGDSSQKVKTGTKRKYDSVECCQRFKSNSVKEKGGNQLNPADQEGLINDLRSLYNTGMMSDINICIGEDTLHAHKLILCARSPVFQKMVEHEFIEATSTCINIIVDCELIVFKTFLKFLYTGEIEERTTDIVMELYILADKYDVKGLRLSCSKILQSEFSSASVDRLSDIVSNILELAECQRDSVLKGQAMKFITDHFPEVTNKQSWKEFLKRNSELASEVLTQVAMALRKVSKKDGI